MQLLPDVHLQDTVSTVLLQAGPTMSANLIE